MSRNGIVCLKHLLFPQAVGVNKEAQNTPTATPRVKRCIAEFFVSPGLLVSSHLPSPPLKGGYSDVEEKAILNSGSMPVRIAMMPVERTRCEGDAF